MTGIRILTMNIHKGASGVLRRDTLSEIRRLLVNGNYNLVCLQEVVGASGPGSGPSQFEVLADGVWGHHSYGKNSVYSRGHHGNAILSMLPISKSFNFDLSSYRLERRGALLAVIERVGEIGAPLYVITVHLDLMAWSRDLQVLKLAKIVRDHVPSDAPLILCGDFNDWMETISDRLETEVGLIECHSILKGGHARTYPSFFPLLKLDRIYVRNLNVKSVRRLSSRWRFASDHLPLVAELSYV